MDRKNLIKVGYVMKTHGLKGEVTLNLSAEAPEILEGQALIIESTSGLVPYFIERTAFNGSKAFIKFDGINTIEDATAIKGCSVFIEKSTRPKLKRGEFYDDELVGFEVVDAEEGTLGKVITVQNQGLNKLLEVGEKGILIPVNGPFITSISKTKKKIEVELPEGFLDI